MTNLNMDFLKNIDLFLKIFNNISDMVYLTKVEGEGQFSYLLANESAKRFVGLTEESFGKQLEEILPKNVTELIIHKYEEAIRTKGLISYEEKMRLPSTINNEKYTPYQYVYWESNITPIFDQEEGNCTHIIAIVRDITERKRKEKEFKKVKERLELIWDSAADAVFTIDTKANFVSVNKAFTNLLGWTEEELFADPSITIIPEHFKEDINEVLEKLRSGEVIPYHLVQRKTKGGSIIDVLASYSPINDEGQCIGAVVMYKDITDQNKYYRQLQESEERYRLIADHSSDLIKVVNLEGIILYASPSHLTVLGIPPEYYVNNSILSLLHSEDMDKLKESLEKVIDSKQSVSLEIRRLKKGGGWIWFETIGAPVFDDDGQVIRVIYEARDITERKEYEQKLEQLALYDHLTGLPNRTLFYRRLKDQIEHAKRSNGSLAIMFLDLDRFKQINDTMGHDIGDELLKGFGERVRGCLREKDTFARLGGDEFVILLPNLRDDQEPNDIAKAIIQTLQEPWVIGEYRFTTTSSIGIALYPPYEIEHSKLLKHADIALYQAKEKGRNNYQVYHNEMDN
jgi:diguanylate cyclase (GGDEF)-like protein/PAS domain S-box-containing protein